jgi:hypothetical protein
MSYTISVIRLTFNPSRNLRTAVLTGSVDEAELLASYATLGDEPRQAVDDLIDASGLERLEVSSSGVLGFLEIVGSVTRGNDASSRLALIAPDQLVAGAEQLCEDVVSGRFPGRPIRIFRTCAEAHAWLSRPTPAAETYANGSLPPLPTLPKPSTRA